MLNLANVNGGVIDLKGAVVPPMVISKRTFDPANPLVLHNGTIEGLVLDRSHNIIILDATIRQPTARTLGLGVRGGSNIKLSNVSGKGMAGYGGGKLVQFENTVGAMVENSDFSGYNLGIVFRFVRNGYIRNSYFHSFLEDSIRLVSCKDVEVSANRITGFLAVASGAGTHPDGIQLFTENGVQNENITIADNRIWRGVGNAFQGIFARYYPDQPSPRNLVITGNKVAGAKGNGIAASGTGQILDNEVIPYVDQKSALLWDHWVGPIDGNKSPKFTNKAIGFRTPTPPGNTVTKPLSMAEAAKIQW